MVVVPMTMMMVMTVAAAMMPTVMQLAGVTAMHANFLYKQQITKDCDG